MNHNQKLLQDLYSIASGKYVKFKVRLDKAIQTGRFYKLNKRKQSSLVSRLKGLYERLKSLQTQLRLAAAGATLTITLAVNNPVQGQSSLGPFERNDASNPLPPPFFIDRPRLAVVDIDKDGDLDIFAGSQSGDIEFFRNNANVAGPKPVTRFTKITGASNPFNGINKGPHAAPAFADVDGDGDLDMVLGVNDPNYGYNYSYSRTFFFRNTGSSTNPIFNEQTGTNNPFNGIYGSKYGPAIPAFVDMDGDADQDLFIGSSYSADYYNTHNAVKFFENTGGNFAPSVPNLTFYLRYFNSAAMTFADIDENGELDVLVSDGLGSLRFFTECSSEFCEQFGAWDPVAKTGNPMNGFNFPKGSPALADFDGDGDLDLIVGQYSTSVTNLSVSYFENVDGDYTFKNRDGLNISPLGGVDVGREAAPVFTDLDGDSDLDAVIGSKYPVDLLFVYENIDGNFFAVPEHPLIAVIKAIPGGTTDVIPVFVDIDNDADEDAFICMDYRIEFLRKSGGSFIHETTLFPTLTGSNSREISLAFVDVDKDGDFDALVGNDRYVADKILYFQNTGTVSSPIFTATTPPSPFNSSNLFQQNANLKAVDLDNDGDMDIVISETYYFQSGYNGNRTRVRFFANNGNGTFTEENVPIIAEGSPKLGFTNFNDIDGDGDLDALMGNGYASENGTVTYFENTNPSPTTQFPTTVLPVDGGTATLIFPTLILTDIDDDKITEVIVSIANFRAGDETLTFTPQSGITGSFNTSTGALTLTGLASIASYQAVLRSITYQFIGTPPTTSGRLPGGRTNAVTLDRSITIGALDQDLTSIIPNILAIQISFPNPNQPPVITPPTAIVAIGNTIDLDFASLISDPNSNLDASSFNVIQDPISGATFTITGLVVRLNYAGRSFTGLDEFTVEICDLAGACTTSIIFVEVVGEVIVYNGFSPNGDADNPYFQIANITLLEPQNKVTIFNRWGARVFEIENYDNDNRRFEGKNNNGNDLPSGTYFYKIEFASGRKELSGYLTIKK